MEATIVSDRLKHYPVLLKEIISIISPQYGGTFIDCTFGQGGYSKEILKFPNTKVIGIDRDVKSKRIADQISRNFEGRFFFKNIKFPLGNLLKTDVRKLAEAENLITYDKKDSTGICFIGERPFPEFLKNYLPEDYGEIVDENDEVIGEHKGLYFYTIGQRQGLGIGGMKNRAEKAWYVAQKDFSNNKLIVVQENDHPLLFKQKLSVSNINWLKQPSSSKVSAKIRYRQKDQDCEINIHGNKAKVFFKEPQRAVTPGQFIVFYEDEICLGGGEIDI